VVAPVIEADARSWDVYLPAGADWIHLWSAVRYAGGASITVDAPLGAPPVFYRADSDHAALFADIGRGFPA
jgi:alpha-glucosidase